VILGAVLLAAICWALTFGTSWGNFWLKIGFSVIVVFLYSLVYQRPRLTFRFSSVLLGALSAAVLYGIFFLGRHLAPYVLPGSGSQVGDIYALGFGTNRILIFLLLFFITGPGEEIFWRGFLQARLMERWGKVTGAGAAAGFYAAVHIFSGNLVLTAAALVAGAFWGALYLWKRDLLLQIVSHSIWSSVIFALFPLH
jgi:membrane protease YdiL (CAAX protease family)